jgi:hypothetical protein
MEVWDVVYILQIKNHWFTIGASDFKSNCAPTNYLELMTIRGPRERGVVVVSDEPLASIGGVLGSTTIDCPETRFTLLSDNGACRGHA